MIITFSLTIARRASKGLSFVADPDDHQPTQMIISHSPNTSLTRQRRFFLPGLKILGSASQEITFPPSQSPTVPQTHIIMAFSENSPGASARVKVFYPR